MMNYLIILLTVLLSFMLNFPNTASWKKTNASHWKREEGRVLDSPVTSLRSSFNDAAVPNCPTTGTPAPWAPRLSVLARVPQVNTANGKGDESDPIKPVFVAEFPQAVRNDQSNLLHKRVPVEDRACGEIDKSTSLAWIICGNRIFLWSYLSRASSAKCVVLEIPLNDIDFGKNDAASWLLCIVNCDSATVGMNKVAIGNWEFMDGEEEEAREGLKWQLGAPRGNPKPIRIKRFKVIWNEIL